MLIEFDTDKFNLIVNTYILAHQFSNEHSIDVHLVLEHSFDKLFTRDKELPKYIFYYPNKNMKSVDLKKILKVMNKPVSGNKLTLYTRVCDLIDDWRKNFSNEFIEKYV